MSYWSCLSAPTENAIVYLNGGTIQTDIIDNPTNPASATRKLYAGPTVRGNKQTYHLRSAAAHGHPPKPGGDQRLMNEAGKANVTGIS